MLSDWVAWVFSHWHYIVTAVGAVSLRWGRVIFRILAAPFVVGTLRERLLEREAQAADLVSEITFARSERDYYRALYEQTGFRHMTRPSPGESSTPNET